MTARSQCDHWDCPVVSDFKAWLFLSLPQNASLSPWETLDFSGIFLRFGFTWKNGVKLGLKSRTFLVPNFARFIQSFLLQIIRLFCRQPCGEPAGWDYIDLRLLLCPGGAAIVVGASPRRIIRKQVQRDDVCHHVDLNVIVVPIQGAV